MIFWIYWSSSAEPKVNNMGSERLVTFPIIQIVMNNNVFRFESGKVRFDSRPVEQTNTISIFKIHILKTFDKHGPTNADISLLYVSYNGDICSKPFRLHFWDVRTFGSSSCRRSYSRCSTFSIFDNTELKSLGRWSYLAIWAIGLFGLCMRSDAVCLPICILNSELWKTQQLRIQNSLVD